MAREKREPEPSIEEPSIEGEELLPWDVRILARIESGVDGSSIEENLRRTPTERLRRHQQMLLFLEETRRVRRPADP